jgi:hypothetical protein
MTYAKSTTNSSMIHAYSLKAEHMKNVQDVIDFYKSQAKNNKALDDSTRKRFEQSTLKRSELKHANNVIRQKEYNLYYVIKNDIFHTSKLHREQSLYDLKLFRTSKRVETQATVVSDETQLIEATKKATKRVKAAKVSKVETATIDANEAQSALKALETLNEESNELSNEATA